MPAVFDFHSKEIRFTVVAASPKDKAGGDALVTSDYKFDKSLEGKILTELTDLTWGEFDKARDEASARLEKQLAKRATEAFSQP